MFGLCAAASLAVFAGATHSANHVLGSNPFKIFIVTWRGETDVEKGFRDYLSQRGIPFEITMRDLQLNKENVPAVMEEIKQARPDLVYTWGTGTTASFFGKINNDKPDSFLRGFPGLFVVVSYPIEASLVESFEKPGRSVTGVSFLAPVATQLNTILTYRPFKKIGIIYDPTASNSKINVGDLRETTLNAKIELVEMPVTLGADGEPDPNSIPELVEMIRSKGAEMLYIGPDSFLVRHSDSLTESAIAVGLPTFAAIEPFLQNSRAMFGLVTDYYTMGRLAASQAERILVDKQDPMNLPVASLARYKLWINIDVARELGAYPPMNMISIADFQTSPQ
ncbi:MAG: ABC transporter substrate-binding protein [bacterium]